MRMSLIVFVSIALLIYFTLHALVFLLIKGFLQPLSEPARWLLAGLLFLLALCFIAAFILTHLGGRPWLRAFYYCSALWLGTLVNLLLILSAGFLVYGTLHLIGVAPDRRTFGILLLIFTAFYTAYGLIHARRLDLKSVSVPAKEIPSSWKGKKIVQVSDIHLGMINGEGLSRKIVDLFEEQRPDVVFITGDLFDAVGDHLAEAVAPFNRLPMPIYFVTGNHETYLGLDRVMGVLAGTKIRVLRDEIVEVEGMQVVGVDYPERGMKKDIRPILEKLDRSRPVLLLFHEPVLFDGLDPFPFVLQLSGHTHNGQMWPMKFFTHLVYQGLDYGPHQTEGFFLYTTSGAGTWGPPMRIGSTAEVVALSFR